MPNLTSPDTGPKLEQVSQPKIVEKPRKPISERVRSFVDRFTSKIKGANPIQTQPSLRLIPFLLWNLNRWIILLQKLK